MHFKRMQRKKKVILLSKEERKGNITFKITLITQLPTTISNKIFSPHFII
jgi:hypothetical protein